MDSDPPDDREHIDDDTAQTDGGDDLVRTPGGPRPRSWTHHVPPGFEVRHHSDGSLTVEPAGSSSADPDDPADPDPTARDTTTAADR